MKRLPRIRRTPKDERIQIHYLLEILGYCEAIDQKLIEVLNQLPKRKK